jgi:hypothetical protein
VTTTGLQRAQAVAAAGERLAATHGVVLPDDLRLWALAGGRPSAGRRSTGTAIAEDTSDHPATDRPPPDATPLPDVADVDLAAALEAATSPRQRRARGLHVTPRWLADHLVGLVVDDPPGGDARASGPHAPPRTACDPSCGGGAFLVAVARALHARGLPKRRVVEECLWGADIDPVGLAAAEAALAIWSGGAVPPPGRLVVGDPLRSGIGLWGDDRPADGFDMVVGNPPFQNQLGRATTRARAEQLRLRARFGPAVRAYTDTAWLFLLLGCQFARPGGRVVMVQPDSLAAARDAAVVRAEIDALAHLDELWVDDHNVFAAAVRVCAPVLRRYATTEAGAARPAAGPPAAVAEAGAGAAVAAGAGGAVGPAGVATALAPADAGAATERWHHLLAEATGVPALRMAAAGRLGDRATAIAGFRDEYYGLAAVVREATPEERAEPGPPRVPALVTVGALDWGRCAWGSRPVRFAKRRWEAPVVDTARLAADGPAAARRWVSRTAVPKVLVATQTRVVELAVDEAGTWVPSVPAIAVVPADPDDLWHLAAALASPAATVWLMRRAPGVALARGALKVAARDVADLPLPADRGAWDVAATALRAYAAAAAPAPGGPASPAAREALDAFTCAGARAYASAPEVVAWWRARLLPPADP